MRSSNWQRTLPQVFLVAVMSLVDLVPLPGLEVPHIVVARTPVAPVIDGILTEACWEHAAAIHGLRPFYGGTYQDEIDLRPTEIRLLWDEDCLYVSFSCRNDDIYTSGTMKHDEDLYKEDVCEVFIDGKGDQRQWLEIQVSPDNQILDLMSMLTTDPVSTATGRLAQLVTERDLWSDRSWDAVGLKTATGRLKEHGSTVGWTVEMAIPARNLIKRIGGTGLRNMELRANFLRYDHPRQSGKKRGWMHMNWAPVECGCPHLSPAAMGKVMLIDRPDDMPGEARALESHP